MTTAFYSDAWFRVEKLKPRLQPQARIHRQRYRGRAWYVVHDPASGRLHRFTPAAYLVLGLMDGQRSVDQVWKLAVQRLGDDAPSQDEVLQLLSQLHEADLLLADVSPDVEHVLARERKQRRSVWVRNLVSPTSLRLPLWDPDAFLTRTLPLLRPLFGPMGAVLWLALVLPALALAGLHWRELTGNLSDRVLAFDNLLLLLFVFPLVKAVHEMAHGWAVKAGGGEVHEMGLMFLVFAPVPYVDASASTAFRSKAARAGVAAAGMAAELVLAALAMFVWQAVEPGLVRSLAFNVMLVAGVSTLVFNANPLLRYDGYFILCDLAELPNLAQRSTRWWGWWVQHHLFGAHEMEPPEATPGERRWFVFYGAASWVYRMAVALGIALFIAEQFFFVGVVLGLWSVASGVVWPLLKALRHVAVAPALARHRRRAVGLTGGVLAATLLFAVAVPLPVSTLAEGVVWAPEQAELRAGADGVVRRLLRQPGDAVVRGDLLAELDDPSLWAEHDVQVARVERMQAQLAAHLAEDRAQAAATWEALAKEEAGLRRLQERIDHLAVVARTNGRLVMPRAADLPGRHLRQGEAFGHVLDGELRTVRVVVAQDDVGLLRRGVERIEVRVADRLGQVLPARLVREVPGGQQRLPSKALTMDGGGPHAVDPRDEQGTLALNRVFQFDLQLPDEVTGLRMGGRVYVRFEHAAEPLAAQVWRRLRQLLLSRFDV
ncbi:efflux RND transporter periplasmic adaptor subunit [Aquabacterium sp. J223]|uniref:PqqD family peptide modification chaperone n=1 Tax=Aquabacterium sp. J223 TaxID=2898431 RepID=UPI0021AD605D|nr:efflux RND transporter periplasmic adaptor subunit [Aquabacterium sp. J223]UUX95431.1 efflux RND transporter periplasmic adaptor subunit [Aquabacterium sp. J223]